MRPAAVRWFIMSERILEKDLEYYQRLVHE